MTFFFRNPQQPRRIDVGNKLLIGAWIVAVAFVCWALVFGLPRPRVSVSDAPPRGPVVARGMLVGPAGRKTPSGQGASAWRSWIEASSVGGRYGEVRCVLEELDGLRLLDGRGSLEVKPELFFSARGLPPQLVYDRAIRPEGKVFPDALASRCPPAALAFRDQTIDGVWCSAVNLRYWEHALPPDAEVDISACREGEVLLPCGDGKDEIGTDLSERVSWGGKRSFPEHGELLEWLGEIVLVLGGLTGFWVVYSRRVAP